MKGGQGLDSHLDRDEGSCGNLGASLHGVPQLTLDMGGILIRQAQRLLLEWREKAEVSWGNRNPQDPTSEKANSCRLIRSLGPWRRRKRQTFFFYIALS